MKLLLEQSSGLQRVTAQGAGYVDVNGERHSRSLIVLGDRVISEWAGGSFEELKVEDFAILAGLGTTIVLVGTGRRLRFPHPALLRPLIENQRGYEVMDTAAACRTYNILVTEGRSVCAALLVEQADD